MKNRGVVNSVAFLDLKSRRGQVTIFVILAIIIVAVAALIYFLYPKIKSTFNPNMDPQSYIQSCVQSQFQQIVYNVSMNGGSIDPEHYVFYNNSKVAYLCYTNKNLLPCTMQVPFIKDHIESQIETYIKPTSDNCFQNLKSDYEKKGYTVDLTPGNVTADILPNRILVTFNTKLTLTKSSTQRYTQFVVPLNSNLYELTGISQNIVAMESAYGGNVLGAYNDNNHNILVQLLEVKSDGTKIYSVTALESGNVFQFATRSLVWPPGFGGTY